LCKEHLSSISRADLQDAIAGVTNLTDKAKDVWNMLTGPISAGIAVAAAHWGFKGPELRKFEEDKSKVGEFHEQIRFMSGLVPKFGFFSTYILVDKVDENVLTGAASTSAAFIKPLLSDLSMLEMPGTAFKLFLWDRTETESQSFSRADRIKTYRLSWHSVQLKAMLAKRLAAHSDQKVTNLSSLVDLSRPVDIDELVVNLSGGSPRNIIRICKAIFDHQSEIDSNSNLISEKALIAGIEEIASSIAAETVPENVLRDLKKLKRADFTVTNVYADVFRISQGSGTQKVQSWQDCGAVIKIGNRQERKGNRPSNVYAVNSPIVLKHVFSDMNVLDFSEKKMRLCSCGQLVLRDWDSSKTQSCHACEHYFKEDVGDGITPP
jgi:hypothetical protein